jgi:hypothetical protein
MQDTNSITFRLESYLLQLSEINRRWSEWLQRGETAAITGNIAELKAFETQASELTAELSEIVQSRQNLLVDAQGIGLPSNDLHSLARSLPAWQRPRLRASIAAARQQLSDLRRLHAASWILLNQRLQLYRDSISLMMLGTSKQSVYLPGQPLDGGGQLLDASL